MANDLLGGAIRAAGLDVYEVADVAGVNYRSVQRWIGGRVPHPRYRQKLAQALGVDEQELWPETGRVRGKALLGEIVAVAARRGDRDTPDWRPLFRSATRQVDMLGYSLEQVTAGKAAIKALAAKAAAGCPVRICLADPNSEILIATDAQQRPPGRLLARVQESRRQLLGLLGQPGTELRQHRLANPYTVLRFDELMLVTLHLHATPGFQAPVLQLRRELDFGLFDQFAKHFEEIWELAIPTGDAHAPSATSARAAATARSAEQEKQHFLDSLDRVYRHGS